MHLTALKGTIKAPSCFLRASVTDSALPHVTWRMMNFYCIWPQKPNPYYGHKNWTICDVQSKCVCIEFSFCVCVCVYTFTSLNFIYSAHKFMTLVYLLVLSFWSHRGLCMSFLKSKLLSKYIDIKAHKHTYRHNLFSL